MEELQNRRDFFKKAAKGMLPILAVAVVGPSLLSSCEKEDDDDDDDDEKKNNGGGCGCGTSCSGSCDQSCSGSCYAECSGSSKW